MNTSQRWFTIFLLFHEIIMGWTQPLVAPETTMAQTTEEKAFYRLYFHAVAFGSSSDRQTVGVHLASAEGRSTYDPEPLYEEGGGRYCFPG